MVKSLSTSWEGRNLLEDKAHQGSSTASLCDFYEYPSRILHIIVFSFMLYLFHQTQSCILFLSPLLFTFLVFLSGFY